MLKPRRFQSDQRFFHLNSGLSPRTWRTTKPHERWKIFCQALNNIQFRSDLAAHAFVLMDTHFHILFSTRSMKERALAEEFHQHLSALCNCTWDALEVPLYCESILSAEYYKRAYKYIYRNPVEAGMCSRAEDYEFSSLRGLLGRVNLQVPVIDNMGLIFGPKKILTWLNEKEEEPQLPFIDTST